MYAKDVMTTKVISMPPDTNIYKAIGILVDNKISGAPVVDDNGTLLGIVTEKDLLVSLDFVGEKNINLITVEEIMTRDIITYKEDSIMKNISAELVRRNIKRVPIIKDGKIVGIVSRRDILRGVRQK